MIFWCYPQDGLYFYILSTIYGYIMPVYVEIVLINLIFYIKYATIGNVMIDNSVVSTIPRLQIELSKP